MTKSNNQLINEAAQIIDDVSHKALCDGNITEYVKALRVIRANAADIARLTSMLAEEC